MSNAERQERFTKWHEFLIFVIAPTLLIEIVNRVFNPPIWTLILVAAIPLIAILHLIWIGTERTLKGGRILVVLVILAGYIYAGVRISAMDRERRLKAAQEDAWRNISIDFSFPEGKRGDLKDSRIIVTNASAQNLTDRHLLLCQSVLTTNPGGLLDQATMLAQSNKEPGKWYLVFREPFLSEIERSFPISGNGTNGTKDAITESCIARWKADLPISCSDIKIVFFYFVETQPDSMQNISKRVVIKRGDNGDYDWYPEAIEKPGSGCCPAQRTEFAEFNQWCYGSALGPPQS
jgi:hypothetical protein